MPRLAPFINSEDVPEYAEEAHGHVARSRGRVPAPSGVLLRAPAIAAAFSDICGILEDGETEFDKGHLELAICIAARAANNDYIWSAHAPKAEKFGVDERSLEAVSTKGSLEGVDPDDAMIIQFGRELLGNDQVSTATFDAVLERFGDRKVTELIAALGAYLMTACIIRGAGIELRPDGLRMAQLS